MFFSTLDFGESDILHYEIPAKYLLYQALRANSLPFWVQNIGNGFPLFSALGSGSLNPINIILLKILAFPIAFNLIYVTSFSINALGAYLFCRKIKLPKLVCLYVGTIYSFSGYFIVQIPHTGIIQTASLLPWYFYATYKIFYDKKKTAACFLLSLIIAVSIFSGHPQPVFISLMGSILFVMRLSISTLMHTKAILSLKSPLILFSIAIVLGFLMGSAQLFPAVEYLQNSIRSEGLSINTASYFSFPPAHLLGFIYPFALGNPMQGNYPPFQAFNGSIFWENTGYVGILPILFAIAPLFFKMKLKENNYRTFFLTLLTFSFLLMLGKYSFLKNIHSLPVFSLFRVPSRFILLFVWSLVVLSGLTLEYILIKTGKLFSKYVQYAFFILIFILSFLDIQRYFYSYNPLIRSDKLLAPPESAIRIKKDSRKGRVITVYDDFLWNSLLTSTGWKNTDGFLFLRNSLRQNINVLYDINQLATSTGNELRKNTTFNNILSSGISIKNDQIYINQNANKLLSLQNVSYIITPHQINDKFIQKETIKSTSKGLPDLYLYTLPVSKRAFIVHKKMVANSNEMQSILKGASFNPKETVLLEKEDNRNLPDKKSNIDEQVTIIKSSNELIRLKVKSSMPGYLVLTDTFYPGWEATVNGRKSNILVANLSQKAIYIPQGISFVNLRFSLKSFKIGTFVSITTFLTYFLLLTLRKNYARN